MILTQHAAPARTELPHSHLLPLPWLEPNLPYRPRATTSNPSLPFAPHFPVGLWGYWHNLLLPLGILSKRTARKLHSLTPSAALEGAERSQEDSTDSTTEELQEQDPSQSQGGFWRYLLILSVDAFSSECFSCPSSNHSCCFWAKPVRLIMLKCCTHGTSRRESLGACKALLNKSLAHKNSCSTIPTELNPSQQAAIQC